MTLEQHWEKKCNEKIQEREKNPDIIWKNGYANTWSSYEPHRLERLCECRATAAIAAYQLKNLLYNQKFIENIQTKKTLEFEFFKNGSVYFVTVPEDENFPNIPPTNYFIYDGVTYHQWNMPQIIQFLDK